MTPSEFVNTLKADNPKNYTNEAGTNLMLYINRLGLSGDQIEQLSNKVLEYYQSTYRYFPTVSDVKDILNQNSIKSDEVRAWSLFTKERCIEETSKWELFKILNFLEGIREIENVSALQVIFWSTWSDLLMIKNELMLKKMSTVKIDNYLEKVKLSIINGEQVIFNADNIKLFVDDENYCNPMQFNQINKFDFEKE